MNLPGLRCTRGKKAQRFKKFGNAGLLVYSSSSVEDVPAAHTFSVDDMCLVRAIGDNEIEVELSFEVKFKASTMLKYMIESNTNREMEIWLKKFATHLKEKGEGGLDSGVQMPALVQSATGAPMKDAASTDTGVSSTTPVARAGVLSHAAPAQVVAQAPLDRTSQLILMLVLVVVLVQSAVLYGLYVQLADLSTRLETCRM